jgi:hypothetical protein
LAEREAELLPVPYFHVVCSLPADDLVHWHLSAQAKAPRHTGRAKDRHRHLMMTPLLRDSICARCFRRHRRCTCRHVGLLRHHDQTCRLNAMLWERCLAMAFIL